MSTPDSVTLGPLELTYLPDGDDPGTGALRVKSLVSGLEGTTPLGYSRVEWDEFVVRLKEATIDV